MLMYTPFYFNANTAASLDRRVKKYTSTGLTSSRESVSGRMHPPFILWLSEGSGVSLPTCTKIFLT